jgi:hypothetical protein
MSTVVLAPIRPVCPYCGGSKQEPNLRPATSLFPAGKCASKFHLMQPEPSWEQFKADRNRQAIRIVRKTTPSSTSAPDYPDIILYLLSIAAIVDLDKAAQLSGISARVLSRGKHTSLKDVAVLKWKRQKFFFVDTLPSKEDSSA